jgi:uncharacterized circularly permuted ATP-grasp superfamily protein
LKTGKLPKRIFPEMIASNKVRMVNNYPLVLHNILQQMGPQQISDPTVVLLTPGIYNSAYYEHTFLARQMGVQLG